MLGRLDPERSQLGSGNNQETIFLRAKTCLKVVVDDGAERASLVARVKCEILHVKAGKVIKTS